MPRPLVRALVLLAVSALLLLVLEFAARVALPLHEFEVPRLVLVHRGNEVVVQGQEGLKQPATDGRYRTPFKPNLEFRWCYDVRWGGARPYMDERGCVTAHTNALGLRGELAPREKSVGRWRVAALGDSFTFGHGVPDGVAWIDALRAPLQELLDRRGAGLACETLNFGISGFSTRDVAHFCASEVLGFAPDVVVYGFFLNDVFVEEEDGARGEQGAAIQRYNQALYGPRPWWARHSQVARRAQLALARSRFDSVTSYSQAYAADSQAWIACQAELASLARSCAEAGTRLLVAVFPDLVGLEGAYPNHDAHEAIAAFLRSQEIAFVDLRATYLGRRSPELWVHPTDHHPNEIAHELAAQAIAAALAPYLP